MPPVGDAMSPFARAAVLRAFAETALRLGRRRVRPRVALALDARTPEAFERGIEEARAAMDMAHRTSRTRLRCPVGAVLPVPRAVMTADAVAESAEFLVLPVRELDAWMRGRPSSADADADSSQRFDTEGLGALIEAGLKRARTARPGLACGVMVEDAPDPALLRLCMRADIHQVVCPPSKIAAARLATAQTAIRSGARQF
jgi:pyruvate,orthophosphate dikinase